jgi:rubrerythrin
MHAISGLLGRLFTSPTTIYECRHCGTTLDDEADRCPSCGGSETSRYEVS